MYPVLFVWLAIQANRNEHRDEQTFVASGMVVGKLSGIAEHLVNIGGFSLHAILELDDEDGAVLENDQIGTSAPTTWNLEFENERKSCSVRKARAQFVAQRTKRSVPRKNLRRSCFFGKGRQPTEEYILRRIEKRLHIT